MKVIEITSGENSIFWFANKIGHQYVVEGEYVEFYSIFPTHAGMSKFIHVDKRYCKVIYDSEVDNKVKPESFYPEDIWNRVPKKFNYITIDENNFCCAYMTKPIIGEDSWGSLDPDVFVISSDYIPYWKESLIERPKSTITIQPESYYWCKIIESGNMVVIKGILLLEKTIGDLYNIVSEVEKPK